MADKSTFVGARLRVATSEGEYEGTVHSIDAEKRKLTLTKGERFVQFIQRNWSYISFSFPDIRAFTHGDFVNNFPGHAGKIWYSLFSFKLVMWFVFCVTPLSYENSRFSADLYTSLDKSQEKVFYCGLTVTDADGISILRTNSRHVIRNNRSLQSNMCSIVSFLCCF